MTSFDIDFTLTERDAYHARIATLRARTPGSALTVAQADAIVALLLDNKRIMLDDAQFASEDREFSRALNAEGYPNVPEYRHEFLVRNDPGYRAAWAYEYTAGYPDDWRERADNDPALMQEVLDGRIAHSYLENDPGIVWRSLYRNGWRKLVEGEEPPPEPMGRYAPTIIAILPSLSFKSVVPPFGLATPG